MRDSSIIATAMQATGGEPERLHPAEFDLSAEVIVRSVDFIPRRLPEGMELALNPAEG